MEVNGKLLDCINKLAKDTKAEPFDRVFMYVKNYCHFSAKAAGMAAQVCKKVHVLDVLTGQYVTPMDLHQTMLPSSDKREKRYMQAYTPLKGSTVPQIFLHCKEWKYVGGCIDFEHYLTVLNSSQKVDNVHTMFQAVKF